VQDLTAAAKQRRQERRRVASVPVAKEPKPKKARTDAHGDGATVASPFDERQAQAIASIVSDAVSLAVREMASAFSSHTTQVCKELIKQSNENNTILLREVLSAQYAAIDKVLALMDRSRAPPPSYSSPATAPASFGASYLG
jgi:hypothetical protein